MRSVLFALPSPKIPGALADKFLYQPAGHVTSYEEVGDAVARKMPDALVISDNVPRGRVDLEQALYGARQTAPEMQIVVIVTRSAADAVGHIELTTRDLENVQVLRMVEGIEDKIADLLKLEVGGASRAFEMTCWSPKGGVGKTTLNIALAEGLTRVRPNTKVIIWDLDLYDADVADGCGVEVSRGHDLTGLVTGNDYSPQTVRDAIYEHRSGIHVLAAPQSPIDAEAFPLTPERFDAIRQALLYLGYEFIIYDLPVNLFLFQPAIKALQACSQVFLVVNPDRFPLKAIGRVIPVLANQGLLPRCKFVINKNRAMGTQLTPQRLKDFFGPIETIAKVAPDPLLGESQEARQTVWDMDKDRTSRAAKDIETFALEVLKLAGKEPSQPQAKGGSGFRLFGR